MKKIFIIFGLSLLMACENESGITTGSELTNESNTTTVSIHVDDFLVEQGEILPTTRATTVGDYANLKAITLAFYKSDGTEAYKHTQFKEVASTYTTFGEFSTSLPMGSFTMVVLGYTSADASGEITLTSATSAGYEDGVRETFCSTQEVNVNTNTPINLTATLSRIIAKVTVASTDGRTADVHAIRTTFSGGGTTFNPTTGLNVSNTGYSKTVVTNRPVGSTTSSVSALFLASDEQTMDITIETLDEDDNVLFSKTVTDVPLKRNRATTLTGAMYTASASAGSFQLTTTEWLTTNSVNF